MLKTAFRSGIDLTKRTVILFRQHKCQWSMRPIYSENFNFHIKRYFGKTIIRFFEVQLLSPFQCGWSFECVCLNLPNSHQFLGNGVMCHTHTHCESIREKKKNGNKYTKKQHVWIRLLKRERKKICLVFLWGSVNIIIILRFVSIVVSPSFCILLFIKFILYFI